VEDRFLGFYRSGRKDAVLHRANCEKKKGKRDTKESHGENGTMTKTDKSILETIHGSQLG
jgi:hypothetical protein